MVYKSLHELAPEHLLSRFTRELAYNLCDSENKFCFPLPRTNYYKNSFRYRGAILWNSLPCNVRQVPWEIQTPSRARTLRHSIRGKQLFTIYFTYLFHLYCKQFIMIIHLYCNVDFVADELSVDK